MERHILREGTSSCSVYSSNSQGVPTLAPPCNPCRQRGLRRLWPAACPWLDSDSLPPSKSDHVVLITWSPSGYTPVVPDCPDVLSYACLLITGWLLVKAHGVTRNKPKIHVICYITIVQHNKTLMKMKKLSTAGKTWIADTRLKDIHKILRIFLTILD